MYHRFPVCQSLPFFFFILFFLTSPVLHQKVPFGVSATGLRCSDCSDIPSLARKKYPNIQDRRSVRRRQRTRLCSLITRLIRTSSVSSLMCPQTTRALELEHELTLCAAEMSRCAGVLVFLFWIDQIELNNINPLEYVILCTCTSSSLFMCTTRRRIIRIHRHSL